jgi:hypothetical protein
MQNYTKIANYAVELQENETFMKLDDEKRGNNEEKTNTLF